MEKEGKEGGWKRRGRREDGRKKEEGEECDL